MARDWRRAGFAALCAAILGGVCALGAYAQPADDEPEEDQAKSAAESPQPKGKRRQDPAEAQRNIETALKQLQAGRAEQAIQAASAVLMGGNLPPAIMAKALYVRGAAYRQQGRSAQAISDLNSALWLRGGLGGDDRDEAVRARAAAYADAGLGDPGESAAPAPRAAASGGGGGNWLSGLFGGSSTPTPPPAPPPRPAPQVSAAPVERDEPAPAPKASAARDGWAASKVQARPAERASVTAAPAPPAAKPAPRQRIEEAAAPRAEGHFLVQLGAVRTEAEAKALAAKAKREHAGILGSRGQSIDRAVLGNMGAFYMVRFGPFASAQETQAACARIQGAGLDCVPVSR